MDCIFDRVITITREEYSERYWHNICTQEGLLNIFSMRCLSCKLDLIYDNNVFNFVLVVNDTFYVLSLSSLLATTLLLCRYFITLKSAVKSR